MGSLGGCQLIAPLGGPLGEAENEPRDQPWPFTSSLAQLTPPPVPLRKPRPPGGFLAQTAVLRAAAETVLSAPLNSAPITTRSLAPLRKPAVASSAASSPAPARAASRAVSANYRVQAGDTVYGVARRFAVPLRGVIDANGLRPPYALRVGQVLQVPNPRRHMVLAGDTVYGVARRYGAEPSQIVRLNRIAAPYTLAPGQKLSLPVPSRSGGGQVVVKAAGPTPARLATSGKTVAKAVAIPAPPPRASGKFLWPVRGRTIAGYGRKKNGLHNDGINIAAPRGAPVRAADNGVVAYVGNELRGFGNLILIKHAGGWVTAYAHTERFLVRRGQTVARGQEIARIGSSGNVATPQLHFEIRKGARSVDPTRFLGPQRASAS